MDEFDSTATCFISTRVRHRVTTMTVREDVLITVRKGVKTLLGSTAPIMMKPGESIVLVRGSQWDVVNDPAGDGRYEALVLQFGDQPINEFDKIYSGDFPVAPTDSCFAVPPSKAFQQTVERAAQSIAAPDLSQRIRQHRVMETLLLLAEQGCRLRPRHEVTWPEQLRRLIGNRPHADWTVETLARACNTSPSTLRRKLAGFGLTVGGLLRETRLEVALSLLQTTELPIGEIAQRCGYESHSRFTAMFRNRYGFSPSDLRSGHGAIPHNF